MGKVNQPSNLLDRVKRLEQQVSRLWKSIGLSSATIGKGGLTLLDNAFLRLFDTAGRMRVFIGFDENNPLPNGDPQPVVYVYDGLNRLRFAIYDSDPTGDGYNPVVWTYDHLGHIAFTTDKNGGVAEPWIPVPMYLTATDATLTADSLGIYHSVPVSACNGGTAWEGRIGKVSHPRIQVDGIWGRATGSSGVGTYGLYLAGEASPRLEWTVSGIQVKKYGPADISDLLAQTDVSIQLRVSATGTGTDRLAIQNYGVWMRQT